MHSLINIIVLEYQTLLLLEEYFGKQVEGFEMGQKFMLLGDIDSKLLYSSFMSNILFSTFFPVLETLKSFLLVHF